VIAAGVPDSWRIAEGDEPVTARRCSCPRPLLDTDTDGWTLCAICGHEPSIRLGAGAGAAESASAAMNGEIAGDPTPELISGSS
jgi:hypothetical protein